ncbi:arabinan endo-1,5-alpha-L-arabinosidase [Lacrimispora xylanisolvens]|uniref:Arabinan endo-1,5-alpha-L-arabinosidase n=1 Tax=Lacrimispora xylanisolvens TaxID=384636 RepID=A0A2S6HTM1_9FIRM|nr:glycoside hydrolase family 43 protein [Hungatella xylanolytica]PPK81109.1 arabinan endo-1,5-alpha-L-arabinosidase [Hungatella xylanolytica]
MGGGIKRIKAVKYAAAVSVMVLLVSGGIAAFAGGRSKLPDRVSVHDPSIVKAKNGEYYIFGSHLAGAKSKDLVDWRSLGGDYDNVTNNWILGNVKENLAESFRWAGYDDGDCSGGKYAVWAPDVIWNPYYKNGDGTKGAYMIYYSASSTWRRSCIGYAVSQEIEGPYTYVSTVIYSGFTKDGKPDGKSQRNTRWDTDAIHIKKLIDSGKLKDGLNPKWFTGDEWNHNYCPNAIDPALFFDKQGQRLYMVYGSWSGGIYLLELDRETGAVIYPGTDFQDTISGNYVDRYFGIHLAGGNHQSGEGPYIVYDAAAGYYYLYETYGALTANGGYNMRLFRSKEVTGPYLDAAGNHATDSNRNNDSYGIKLIGNYKFSGASVGYKAAGHNSAFIDEDGQHYLIYHQRFDQGTEYHEVRVHQQFLNQKGWPVTAVFENRNETAGHYRNSEITGRYEFINHGSDTSPRLSSPESITLLEDGKIEGDREGTWEKTKGDRYDYITLRMDNTEYHGVFFKQHNEKMDSEQVMTFTAIGDNNTSIWASRVK